MWSSWSTSSAAVVEEALDERRAAHAARGVVIDAMTAFPRRDGVPARYLAILNEGVEAP